jgi:chemotaxis protein histidine kinase CheA/CheY-like chemotaxis protein
MIGLDELSGRAARLEAALRGGGGIDAGELGWIGSRLAELGRGAAGRSTVALDRSAPSRVEADFDPETAALLRRLFAEEARDHLEAIDSALMQLEGGAPAGRTGAVLPEILRKAHTLKGSASTVGLDVVGRAAHLLEEGVAALASRPPLPGEIERLLQATDLLRALVEAETLAEAGFSEAEAGVELARLAAVLGGDAVPLVVSYPGAVPRVDGGAASAPGVEDDDGRGERRGGDRRIGAERRGGEAPWVRIDAKRLDELMGSLADLVVDRTRIERTALRLKGLAQDLSTSHRALRASLGDLSEAEGDPALSRVREIEAELASSASSLERGTSELVEGSESLRRTTNVLQEQITRTRMMPIRWLHARLQRPLWELARSQGKQVELVIDDESTEMDRALVEQITDALVQLVRNAVAHGIESPRERVAAGKPPVGRIDITARHQGNVVFLEVKDDGAGIDPNRLREVVAARGGPPAAGDGALSDEEALDIIFASGFTTREHADLLSGRGVGLDAVRQSLARRGGEIRVSSSPGTGARFTIQLPMTTAVSQALLFKIGEQTYALPISHVVETVPVRGSELATRDGQELVRIRGRWLPLLRLEPLLAAARPPAPEEPEASSSVIVVQLGENSFGVTCRRVIGPREIVLKPLGSLLAPLALYAAATVSGSNRIQLVLDVSALARAALSPRPGEAHEAAAREASSSRPRPKILLADDSQTIREVVGQILKDAGYQVDTAVDGWEAWERLQEVPYDLLLTDLEMPRLHGFELIAKCRRSESFSRLPILVLTSRTSDRNRADALERGADEFLPKPVNRRIILEHLQRLVPRRPVG